MSDVNKSNRSLRDAFKEQAWPCTQYETLVCAECGCFYLEHMSNWPELDRGIKGICLKCPEKICRPYPERERDLRGIYASSWLNKIDPFDALVMNIRKT